MRKAIYFNKWISPHVGLTRIGLVLILFAAMAQFASFGLIQAHVMSFYGAESEDISFAFQITFAGIISTLPVQFRTQRYFNIRTYLLIAFIAGILLNLGCLFTHDLIIFSVLRFFIGVATCIVAGSILIILFSTLPEEKRMLVGVSIFFSLVLTCGLIVGLGASWVVLRTDWVVFYYILIGLQIIAIVICLAIFKPHTNIRPYPLYQLDWISYILFIFGAVATAFVFIYGPKRYWMSDPVIVYTSVFALFNIGLFLYRKATLKRPLIDLTVFKFGKFLFALFLMLVFWGLKDSINLVYGYSAGVLGWSSADVVNAGMYNIVGVVIATFIALKLILAKKQNLPKLLLAGFFVLCVYHLWLYFRLTPDLSYYELCFPIFLQGLACGFLFVPITIFCAASVPKSTGMTAIIVCAYARFLATLNSITGLYTLQLHYNQKYKYGFLSKLTSDSEVLMQRQNLYKSFLASKGYGQNEATGISNMLIAKSSGVQGQLLTMRSIFMIAAIAAGVVLIVLCCFAIIMKIKTAKETRNIANANL
ncbi:MFS transporter [Sphingobacterium thalpophilum]|uniref:Multidrug resistance protein B n=1 Tax=Sphingobacterium thalpophilum TaxID=259 RepID=A0A4U9VD86_9SPHI|nr:MFS transporter [Sphingobacterium thalpophilum]VTR41134.1 Multidrug resistance protein B [Sphingobacterium thalpophilum]